MSMYMQRRLRRLTHQHKRPYTATINDDGAKTTTARQPLQFHVHATTTTMSDPSTQRPSTTTATSQPTQPPSS